MHRCKTIGFTLVELLIALALGAIVSLGVVSVYAATAKSSSDTVKAVRLNYDLETLMALMLNDIRRAGYWGAATVNSDGSQNSFAGDIAKLSMPSAHCLLYSYDADSDGNIDAAENYGFKLENGSIKMRFSGDANSSCSNGAWQDAVASDQIAISALNFEVGYRCLNVLSAQSFDSACDNLSTEQLPSGALALESRLIKILLAGYLKGDETVTKTVSGSVSVKNDRPLVQP